MQQLWVFSVEFAWFFCVGWLLFSFFLFNLFFGFQGWFGVFLIFLIKPFLSTTKDIGSPCSTACQVEVTGVIAQRLPYHPVTLPGPPVPSGQVMLTGFSTPAGLPSPPWGPCGESRGHRVSGVRWTVSSGEYLPHVLPFGPISCLPPFPK